MTTLQIHLHTTQKEGFALGNSSCLKIQGFERNLLYHFLSFIVIHLLQLRKFFAADLLYFRASLLGEGHANSTRVSGFSAVEAKLSLDASFAFLRSKFRDFDGVHNLGVRVMGFCG